MKKFAWLIAVFLVYEQTTFNVIPCNDYQQMKGSTATEKIFMAPACIDKRVREVSRQKFKNKKEAEAHKLLVEINGYAYRIEEQNGKK